MTEDQRFAARRPDVLVYQTAPLTEDLTLAGPLSAELWVSTTAGDADSMVKLIDVLPPDTPDPEGTRRGVHLGGYQMMVRSEAFRGRFREGYREPKPFTPGQPTRVTVPLRNVMHTFQKGHRVMIRSRAPGSRLSTATRSAGSPTSSPRPSRTSSGPHIGCTAGSRRASKIALPVLAP